MVTGSVVTGGTFQSETNVYGGSLLSVAGDFNTGTDFLLDGSKAVIGGNLNITSGEAIIKNGSTVTIGGLNVAFGSFSLDKTSSATMGDWTVDQVKSASMALSAQGLAYH